MSAVKQLFARKGLDVLSAEASSGNKMSRSLSALDLTMLGIGGIIGTGIFVLSGHVAAANAGPAVIWSFVVAGVCSAFAGLCYAELASMIPVAGSAYTYTIATMGEFPAWIIGWDLILEYLVSGGAIAVGFSGYFQAFIKDAFGWKLPAVLSQSAFAFDENTHSFSMQEGGLDIVAFLFSWMVTLALMFGVKESARVNATIVVFKCIVILIVIFSTMQFVDPGLLTPMFPENKGTFGKFGPTGMLQGATTVFFAYIGFDAVSTTAQEAKNPQRDLPIGILGSLVVCTVLYIAMSVILVGLLPYQSYENIAHPITLAIEHLGPSWNWLAILVSLAAMAGLGSVALVMLLGQPRIFYAMAKDGLLPPVFVKIHPKYKTPWMTTIISGAVVSLAGSLLPIGVLAELTSVGTLFAFLLVAVAVIILRVREPDAPRKFKVPLGPYVIPGLCFLSSGLLICTASVGTLYRLAIWLLIGFVIYFGYGRRHSRLNHPEKYPMEAYDEKEPDFMAGH